MQCATHPGVETELACSRCGKPICPRCLVHTDVGARCRECAHLRRIPTYDVALPYLLRAIGTAVVGGVLGGILWWLLLPRRGSIISYFALFFAIGLGYGIGEGVSWASNRKRGAVLQGTAACGVVIAYLLRNVLQGSGLLAASDLFGYVTVGLAIVVAIGRLR
ncbi:MAG: B-box zinc finger protein [Dehalococcoidia bacterium]